MKVTLICIHWSKCTWACTYRHVHCTSSDWHRKSRSYCCWNVQYFFRSLLHASRSPHQHRAEYFDLHYVVFRDAYSTGISCVEARIFNTLPRPLPITVENGYYRHSFRFTNDLFCFPYSAKTLQTKLRVLPPLICQKHCKPNWERLRLG